MKLSLRPINKSIAEEILKWKYDPPYDFYNNRLSDESLKELLENNYYTVFNEGELFGFFCYGKSAQVPIGHQYSVYHDDQVDIGLGLAPIQTGRGNGEAFLEFIFHHAIKKFGNKPLRLTVANFNKRAIHLYEKMGFEKTKELSNGHTLFFVMVKNVDCL